MLSPVLHRVHPDNIVRVIGVLPHQQLKQVSLIFGEFVVEFRVPIDFDRYLLLGLMVHCLDHLCEGAFAQDALNFEAEVDVVARLYFQVALLVIHCFLPFIVIVNCLWEVCLEFGSVEFGED